MARAIETKTAIYSNYRALMLEADGSSVSVSDIASLTKISRKTFYYHFPDILSLQEWGFRKEIAERIEAQCSPDSLVYPNKQLKDPYPDLPFYAAVPMGVRSIDGSVFFEVLVRYLEENRPYYRQILLGPDNLAFLRYVLSLYYYAFYRDVKYIVGGRSVNKETLARFARYFVQSSLMCYFNEIMLFNNSLNVLTPEGVGNFHHDNLYGAIEKYFASKEKTFHFPKL